jgi:hypothetical protein
MCAAASPTAYQRRFTLTSSRRRQLFDQRELCRDGQKFTTVHDALAAHSPAAAILFERA